MSKNKPSSFKLKYLLILAIGLAFAVGAIILFATVPVTQAHYMMILCSVICLGVFVRFMIASKKELDEYTFIQGKDFGIMIDFESYKVSKEKVLDVFNETFFQWGSVFSDADIAKARKKEGVFWIHFRKMPLLIPGSVTEVNGYTLHSSHMYIGYKEEDQNIDRTALAHELGHVIQAGVTGSWDVEEHHKRSAKHKLP